MTEIPWITGMFRHILHPPGMTTGAQNRSSEQWYINDHCFVVDPSDRLHWFGITNPYPPDGSSRYYAPGSHRHIGHAVAEHPFGPWETREYAFVLPEGTSEGVGAPYVVRSQEEYLIVGYTARWFASRSQDLESWQAIKDVAPPDLGEAGRDPCVLRLDDGTCLLYLAGVHNGLSSVLLGTSRDLLHWKREEPALRTPIPSPYGVLESPFVHRRGDDYYLFVNFSHRQYEETLVFHSRDPRRFDWDAPLCTLFGHASELFEWHERTFISHCGIEDRHWADCGAPYGLWLAELGWSKPVQQP
ncbi:MAG: hypothetical protein PHR35_06855 [Kiritimatiellae bacterium]|nr:hypothetical protein [Kiritimatiellia bacterium]